LAQVNDLLGPLEERVAANYSRPRHPTLLIVGVPRSGTTLMMQWLTGTGRFCYPTNLLSRFYGAPHIGALIQQLLTNPEYGFSNELFDLTPSQGFDSSLGKTKGALSPNEFWYFWRRFFPSNELQPLDEASVEACKMKQFASELAAIEAVFDRPLVMKALHLNFNLPFLARLLDKPLFLHVKRHPLYNMQSLLDARMKFYGDPQVWWSIKPKEYFTLKEQPPHVQVAGQVYYTNLAIESDLHTIDSKNWLRIDYEEFCGSPEKVFMAITGKIRQLGAEADWAYAGPASFVSTNKAGLSKTNGERLIEAYEKISGSRINP
jgi:hypothetical protein